MSKLKSQMIGRNVDSELGLIQSICINILIIIGDIKNT